MAVKDVRSSRQRRGWLPWALTPLLLALAVILFVPPWGMGMPLESPSEDAAASGDGPMESPGQEGMSPGSGAVRSEDQATPGGGDGCQIRLEAVGTGHPIADFHVAVFTAKEMGVFEATPGDALLGRFPRVEPVWVGRTRTEVVSLPSSLGPEPKLVWCFAPGHEVAVGYLDPLASMVLRLTTPRAPVLCLVPTAESAGSAQEWTFTVRVRSRWRWLHDLVGTEHPLRRGAPWSGEQQQDFLLDEHGTAEVGLHASPVQPAVSGRHQEWHRVFESGAVTAIHPTFDPPLDAGQGELTLEVDMDFAGAKRASVQLMGPVDCAAEVGAQHPGVAGPDSPVAVSGVTTVSFGVQRFGCYQVGCMVSGLGRLISPVIRHDGGGEVAVSFARDDFVEVPVRLVGVGDREFVEVAAYRGNGLQVVSNEVVYPAGKGEISTSLFVERGRAIRVSAVADRVHGSELVARGPVDSGIEPVLLQNWQRTSGLKVFRPEDRPGDWLRVRVTSVRDRVSIEGRWSQDNVVFKRRLPRGRYVCDLLDAVGRVASTVADLPGAEAVEVRF